MELDLDDFCAGWFPLRSEDTYIEAGRLVNGFLGIVASPGLPLDFLQIFCFAFTLWRLS